MCCQIKTNFIEGFDWLKGNSAAPTIFILMENTDSLIHKSLRQKVRFKIGLILIVVSYVFWGVTFASGALALHNMVLPWWHIAAVTFILSWIVFAAGLLLAGVEAGRIVRRRFLRFFGQKKGSCPTASHTVPPDSEALKNQ